MLEKLNLLDKQILILINSGMANSTLDEMMKFISSPLPWVFGIVLWLGNLTYYKKVNGYKLFFFCLMLVGLADSTNSYFLKPYIGRIRPCKVYSFVRIVDGCAGNMSFPSNHAVNAMILTAIGSKMGSRLLGIFLIGLAFTMSLSRVYLGVHFPIDVTFGLILGFVYGMCGLFVFEKFILKKN